jgi:hypothetical protein
MRAWPLPEPVYRRGCAGFCRVRMGSALRDGFSRQMDYSIYARKRIGRSAARSEIVRNVAGAPKILRELPINPVLR